MTTARIAVLGLTLCTTLSAFAQMGPGGSQSMGGGQGGMQGGGMRRGPEQMMREADTNNDQKVSREEFLAQAANRFTKMDRNGDGYLTKDDRPDNGHRGGPRDGQEGGMGGNRDQQPPPDVE